MDSNDLNGKTLEELMQFYQQKTAQPIIRKIGGNKPYLEARKVAKDNGGRLPSNALTTQLLMYSDFSKTIPSGYTPAWQRELLVHPKSGKSFKKGEDITEMDSKGRKWVYPSYCIPEDARKSKTALFVDPKHEPVIEGNEVIVTADPYKEVKILDDFLQENGWGKVDKATGIPLAYRKVDYLHFEEKAFLWRTHAEGVRPLVRGDFGGRDVVALYGSDVGFGVGVESREAASQVSPDKITLGELLKVLQEQVPSQPKNLSTFIAQSLAPAHNE